MLFKLNIVLPSIVINTEHININLDKNNKIKNIDYSFTSKNCSGEENIFSSYIENKGLRIIKNSPLHNIGIPDFTVNDNDNGKNIFIEIKSKNCQLSNSQKEWIKQNNDKEIYVIHVNINNEKTIYIKELYINFNKEYEIVHNFFKLKRNQCILGQKVNLFNNTNLSDVVNSNILQIIEYDKYIRK